MLNYDGYISNRTRILRENARLKAFGKTDLMGVVPPKIKIEIENGKVNVYICHKGTDRTLVYSMDRIAKRNAGFNKNIAFENYQKLLIEEKERKAAAELPTVIEKPKAKTPKKKKTEKAN